MNEYATSQDKKLPSKAAITWRSAPAHAASSTGSLDGVNPPAGGRLVISSSTAAGSPVQG
ncbi:MAG: hypothetical protein LBR19_01525 [Bifidobacteriaceae bacterium]|nr:hypothetical protein [Bifidobacteriaceae bacterium]